MAAKLNNIIYGTDLWGEPVKLYDYRDIPDCEICAIKGRGSNSTGKGSRKAKLYTSIEKAIQNQQNHRWGHIGKIKVDKKLRARLGPRHPGLKNNQAWACHCCLDAHWNTARVIRKEKEKNTLL